MRALSSMSITATTLLVVCLSACAASMAQAQELSPELVAQIGAALPDKPAVPPKQPRKLLVFNRCRGFVHSAIPTGAKALELMGHKTGAYVATVTDDPAMFEPETLAQFDAVCMNNSTGPVFMPENFDQLTPEEQKAASERDARLKKSLLDFVSGGKGLVGVHAATDCLYEFPEYGEMIGGYFDGHPWGAGETEGIRIDDPAHPLNAPFLGKGFMVQDEIYQFKEPYSREKLRILLTLDPEKTDMTKEGMKRADGDYAVAWVRSYGGGRVFYCSLGHNDAIFCTPSILEHYLAGIQFAMGDLEADTTPSAQLPAEYLEQSQKEMLPRILDQAMGQVASYDYGQNPRYLEWMSEQVSASHGDDAARQGLAARLATLLSGESTAAAKLYACRELARIGGEAEVPALAALLPNADTTDMARYALERMATPAAGAALRDALTKIEGRPLAGIINSIGQRREDKAVPEMIGLMSSADPMIAQAAVSALGNIASPEAITLLQTGRAAAAPEMLAAYDQALLNCAALSQNADIYTALFVPESLPATRAAALKGIALERGEDSAGTILTALTDDTAIVRGAAAEAMRRVMGQRATVIFTQALPAADPASQMTMLEAFADAKETAALPAVAQLAAEATDAAVRLTALRTLATLGNGSTVPFLAGLAAGEDKDLAKAAREALADMPAGDVNNAIVQLLETAQPPIRAQLARALADRYAHDAVDVLLKVAADPEATVRGEAFKSLRQLAKAGLLAAVTQLMIAEPDDGARTEAENAVVAIANRVEDAAQRSQAALDAFPSTQENIPGRCALVRVLGRLGDDRALDLLRADLKSDNPSLKDAAIRALAEWKGAAVVPDLFEVSSTIEDATLKAIALRGYLRLLGAPSDRPAAETVAMYEKGLALAQDATEKRLALAGLADVPDEKALEVIQRYVEDPEVKDEAALALEKAKNRGYVVTASDHAGDAGLAVDGDPATRWVTGDAQKPGQWFQVDLGWETEVRAIVLDSAQSPGDFPAGYAVFVSNNPEDWGAAVAEGEGDKAVLEITCEPKRGRYVKIEQTGKKSGLWWSIHEMKIEGDR